MGSGYSDGHSGFEDALWQQVLGGHEANGWGSPTARVDNEIAGKDLERKVLAMGDDERTRYEIEPYVSVNRFVFGKKPAEIKKQCGAPFKVEIDNIMETLTELREACSLVYEDKKLAYVEINKHADPVVAGVSVYNEGAIEQLKEVDPDYLVGSRYINFRTLGVCVGGFSKKKIPEGKLVIAYAKDKISFFDYYASE